ncbi:MAG: DUF1566 domain-containing protein [Bacteroidales bacterium]|nr:MAG: DUF1566 domain-containing protein [Bacteroidales bacterium]
MKRVIFLLIVVIASFSISAQNTDYVNYQAVIRDGSGNARVSASVTLLIEIIQGSPSGSVSFSETQTTITNTFGIVNLKIGSENPTGFASIDWSNSPYFIRISVDGTVVGTNQLLSVPYALYAKKTESYTETDPIFLVHPSNSISATNISNWNLAYGWGNHATAGYLTNFTETDPVFGASAANSILSTNISNWNTAYGWGNHTGLYKAISYLPDWSEVINNPISISSPSNNQLLKYSSTSSKWENWTPNYLTSEIDGSVTNEIQTLSLNTNQLTISETGGNTVTFTNWDTDNTDDVTLAAPATGDMLYFNGTSWTGIPKGITGQVLTMGASGAPEWQNSIKIPSALTLAATFNVSTTPVTAILNGVVNPNNLPTTVTFEYGTTTGYGSSATAAQSPVTGVSDVNVTCDLSSLTPGTLYHFRVKAVNALGTSYGDDMSFTLLGIGITWENGIIFYLDNTGLHGLVAAAADQGTTTWGCLSTLISGADGIAVGTGSQNTTEIINGCATAGIAARICRSYSGGSYNDWFLPSKDELGLMLTNLHKEGIGGFSAANYWSSSESSNDNAWKYNFSLESTAPSPKNNSYIVRAARAF